MAKKNQPRQSFSSPVDPNQDWGGEVIQERMPSGAKLKLESDSDCILRFIGQKDISDKMGRDSGDVIYLVMHDGAKVVSMPTSYALSEMNGKWVKDDWYYLHNQAEIEVNPDFNPMKDIVVRHLGPTGKTIKCPKRVSDSGTLTLDAAIIAEINYTRLNYPLRTS